ncbi:response regulator transcription factor [Rhodocytophaga rosea]|uniref:Response regulator transcription factor n=1 Tax=Rhodocytophaga rosea TaxID=2704465 RepID=A0A6C0GG76_9BACT|nr:response regulator transcription factor [Rhodocytophaga rosea]QHT66783.1 response regulator transcription factor [Rhodocytophaga rosea]
MLKREYIKVTLVECEQTAREGFAAMINSTFGYHVISTYATCTELMLKVSHEMPHVILIGTDCLNVEDVETACIKNISKIKNLSPRSKIIVFTHTENTDVVFEVLKAGADGYLTKGIPPVKLLEAIQEVYEGGAPLSPAIARSVVASFHKNTSSGLTSREVQVLALLAKGKTYHSIADHLFIDKETVRTHIKNIYYKLEVHSKSEAIEKALYEKII